MVATIVKDLLLAAGGMLVERLTSYVMFDLRKKFYRRTLRMDLLSFGKRGPVTCSADSPTTWMGLAAGFR